MGLSESELDSTMSKKQTSKPSTSKPSKSQKHEKPISLSDLGDDFVTVVRTVLKSPPMPKKKRTTKKEK
jgi:hypothetical protein